MPMWSSNSFTGKTGLLILSLAGFLALPARADEKAGMPDIPQIEQTCLPTSTANLMAWFGKHGYPKLIPAGVNEDEKELHLVHLLMADTGARFDWGTQMTAITTGISKYIKDAGYDCEIEYRGLEARKPFTQDWLKENDQPNKGFILLLAYVRVGDSPSGVVFTRALNAGHAVTLVNAEPDMILIHDPAHENDETGRKILTPQLIPSGYLQDVGTHEPVSGLLLLSGSLMEAPPGSEIMLTGAVCITLHPPGGSKTPSAMPASGPTDTIAGTAGAPVASKQASTSWLAWLFNLVFKN